MNQINPLHIGALFVVFVVFLFVKLHSLQDELIQATDSYKASEKLAVEVSSLKEVYAQKKKRQKAIKRILASSILQEAEINVKHNEKGVSMNSKTMSQKALNFLMGKILNNSYKIKRLKIKRLSDEMASLEMEIQW